MQKNNPHNREKLKGKEQNGKNGVHTRRNYVNLPKRLLRRFRKSKKR